MSNESAERRRRHADPARPVDEAAGSGTGSAAKSGSGSVVGDAGGAGGGRTGSVIADASPRAGAVSVAEPPPDTGDGVVPAGDGPSGTMGAATPRPLSRRELRELERRRAAGVAGAAGAPATDAGPASSSAVPPDVRPVDATPGATPAGPPQDERPDGAADLAAAAVDGSADVAATPVLAVGVAAPPERPRVPAAGPAPRMADTVPSDTSRYALVHYLALALVACVLGYLVWSLTTGPAEPDSSSTGPAMSTISPSAARTATQGEL